MIAWAQVAINYLIELFMSLTNLCISTSKAIIQSMSIH